MPGSYAVAGKQYDAHMVGKIVDALGDVPVDTFLAEYWQRKPLLVRQAFPNVEPPLSGDELAGLALEEEVESRLVIGAGPWALRHGPFSEEDFADLPERDWTLLVQAVDLWVPEAAALKQRFSFLPPWRLDDVMVSFAVPGGSVGPHYDHYDVFLLQVSGRRHWLVSEYLDGDPPLVEGADLRILRDFQPVESWLLEPGDMLYLPPRVGHWGVAEDACMTCSVGFRAPTAAEMLGDMAVELMMRSNESYLRDPPLTVDMAGEEISPAFVDQARALLRDVLDDDALLADWLARYMTAPKYGDLQVQTGELRRARANGILYENGERVE